MKKFNTVSILGGGLLGSSLAIALKNNKLCKKINLWSRSEDTRNKCSQKDWCDEVFDSPKEAVIGADLVMFCTTTETIPIIAKEVVGCLKSGSISSDVGSAKGEICRDCEKVFKGARGVFIGSHPMAGSEKAGVDHADPNIFLNRTCFVCANDSSDEKVLRLASMWRTIGMTVAVVSPEDHDKIVASISHLPHMVSVNLAYIASANRDIYKEFSGNGFLDTTRIAASDVDMWMSIISHNRKNIIEEMKRYKGTFEKFLTAIESGDVEFIKKILSESSIFRRDLKKKFDR